MPKLARDELTAAQAAKILDVSVRTLQRWDTKDSGMLRPIRRTETNYRVYTKDQIARFFKEYRTIRAGRGTRYVRIEM